jgi:hypothetical protein
MSAPEVRIRNATEPIGTRSQDKRSGKLSLMTRKLIAIGAVVAAALLLGLAFALIGLSTAAAAMFVVALFVPLGVVCTALIAICVAIWRRCHLPGRVALTAGILLAIAIWFPQGALTTPGVLLGIVTLFGCAVASIVGSLRRADSTP